MNDLSLGSNNPIYDDIGANQDGEGSNIFIKQGSRLEKLLKAIGVNNDEFTETDGFFNVRKKYKCR